MVRFERIRLYCAPKYINNQALRHENAHIKYGAHTYCTVRDVFVFRAAFPFKIYVPGQRVTGLG